MLSRTKTKNQPVIFNPAHLIYRYICIRFTIYYNKSTYKQYDGDITCSILTLFTCATSPRKTSLSVSFIVSDSFNLVRRVLFVEFLASKSSNVFILFIVFNCENCQHVYLKCQSKLKFHFNDIHPPLLKKTIQYEVKNYLKCGIFTNFANIFHTVIVGVTFHICFSE